MNLPSFACRSLPYKSSGSTRQNFHIEQEWPVCLRDVFCKSLTPHPTSVSPKLSRRDHMRTHKVKHTKKVNFFQHCNTHHTATKLDSVEGCHVHEGPTLHTLCSAVKPDSGFRGMKLIANHLVNYWLKVKSKSECILSICRPRHSPRCQKDASFMRRQGLSIFHAPNQ